MDIRQGKGSTDFVSLNYSCISCGCTQPLWYLREQWSQHLQNFPSKYDLLHTEHLSSESSDVFLFYPSLSRSFSFDCLFPVLITFSGCPEGTDRDLLGAPFDPDSSVLSVFDSSGMLPISLLAIVSGIKPAIPSFSAMLCRNHNY